MNLENSDKFKLVLSFKFDKSFTYADTSPGKRDVDKREYIRSKAIESFSQDISDIDWWAFRIKVVKSGKQKFDVDNVPKLIIDAFCKQQIKRDGSKFNNLGIYEDDTVDYVKYIEVKGDRGAKDYTKVDVFGFKVE